MAETKSPGNSRPISPALDRRQGSSDDDEKEENRTMMSPGGEGSTAGTEGPGRPQAEGSRDPEAGPAAGWTLPTALERLCGKPFTDEEGSRIEVLPIGNRKGHPEHSPCRKITITTANEMIRKEDTGLLEKAAREGVVKIWALVVDAMKVSGQGVLEKALMTDAENGMLMAAVESKQPAMVKEIGNCVRDSCLDSSQREELLEEACETHGRKSLRLLNETARSGETTMWTAVVEDIFQEHQALLAKVLKEVDGLGHSVLMAAVQSKNPAMVTCVLATIRDPAQVKDLLLPEDTECDTVLHESARQGDIATWTVVVDVLSGEGLLEEALVRKPKVEVYKRRNKIPRQDNFDPGLFILLLFLSPRRSAQYRNISVLAAAVQSKDPAMFEYVLEFVQDTLNPRQANDIKSDEELLEMAAITGIVKLWTLAENALGTNAVKKVLMKETDPTRNRKVALTDAAVHSKEPAMIKHVFEQLLGILDDASQSKGTGVLAILKEAVRSNSPGAVELVLHRMEKPISSPPEDKYQDKLLEIWRGNVNKHDPDDPSAKILSLLMQHSIRPSVDDFKGMDVDASFETWCLEGTVASADNPFIPGTAFSSLLSKWAEGTGYEGEQRKLLALRDRVDDLMLEILKQLPQTVHGFKGGVKECANLFEPEGPAQDPRYLPGPLAVMLEDRRQMKVLCATPLVTDFLSHVFNKGLPDLRHVTTQKELAYLRGEGLVLEGSTLQGTDAKTVLPGTVLPGAQFIAAGVVANPCVYYRVPALRMVLDFSVYIGMLAFFVFVVLLHDEGGSVSEDGTVIYEGVTVTWGEIAFAVYVAGGLWTEIGEMRRDSEGYANDGWNIFDGLGLVISLGGFCVRCIAPDSAWGRSLYALSAPLLVSRILFFAQILPFHGPMIQVIFLMMQEMVQFAIVLVVVMLGFTLSFFALFRTDDTTYGGTWLNLFKAMLGEVEFFEEISEDRYENRYKSVATVLLVVYLVIVTVLLLNLLIAILSTSHDKAQEHTVQEYRLLMAPLIQHYRVVVCKDLLPAPFNLVQLLCGWLSCGSERVKQGVGHVLFWLVMGPVAVVGGTLLCMVSAFFAPYERHYKESLSCDSLPEDRLMCCLMWLTSCFLFLVIKVKTFCWRLIGCPLQLVGWWLLQIVWCGRYLLQGGCCFSVPNEADAERQDLSVDGVLNDERGDDAERQDLSVDGVLNDERGDVSMKKFLGFLDDPLSDYRVREDEKRMVPTVQMKLLGDSLERKMEMNARKVDTLQRTVAEMTDLIQQLLQQQGSSGSSSKKDTERREKKKDTERREESKENAVTSEACQSNDRDRRG